ncbi:MAG: MBL fold metallo-hydrolase [Clostridia bacterium]|nr:MBL fold metallo-hydrolase [Clostridia bacterium]
MKIIPIVFGRTTLPCSWVFSGGDESVSLLIALRLFLIEADGRLIAVDAGCDTMPGFTVSENIGPARAIADAGYSPLDVTDLILTHSHHDHTECASLFKNATVYINTDEYESAKKYIPDEMKVVTFDEAFDLTPAVRILRIGGHTAGSSVVEVEAGEITYVLAGDECYSSECILCGIPTGISYNKERSAEFIKKYSHEKYRVLVTHDEHIDEVEYV